MQEVDLSHVKLRESWMTQDQYLQAVSDYVVDLLDPAVDAYMFIVGSGQDRVVAVVEASHGENCRCERCQPLQVTPEVEALVDRMRKPDGI